MAAYPADKPVYVYHGGEWRPYRWSRDLLEVTCLGDVITGLEGAESEDCAATHLYSTLRTPADVVAVRPPSDAVWEELEHLLLPTPAQK